MLPWQNFWKNDSHFKLSGQSDSSSKPFELIIKTLFHNQIMYANQRWKSHLNLLMMNYNLLFTIRCDLDPASTGVVISFHQGGLSWDLGVTMASYKFSRGWKSQFNFVVYSREFLIKQFSKSRKVKQLNFIKMSEVARLVFCNLNSL